MGFQTFIHMLEMNLLLAVITAMITVSWNSTQVETHLATVSWNG